MLYDHAHTQRHGPQAGMDHVLGYRNRCRDKGNCGDAGKKQYRVLNMAMQLSGLTPGWSELEEQIISPPPSAASSIACFTAASTCCGVPFGRSSRRLPARFCLFPWHENIHRLIKTNNYIFWSPFLAGSDRYRPFALLPSRWIARFKDCYWKE